MKKNRATFWTIWCTVLLLFLAAGPAKAEVKPIDQTKIQDIKKLLELIRLEEVVLLAAENTLERFFPILKKATAQNNQAVSDTLFAILKGSTLSLVKRQISAEGGLMDRVVPLYDKHYTHGEIRSLIQFYESPLGKKVTALRLRDCKRRDGRGRGMDQFPRTSVGSGVGEASSRRGVCHREATRQIERHHIRKPNGDEHRIFGNRCLTKRPKISIP
jgi:hypothetical protein